MAKKKTLVDLAVEAEIREELARQERWLKANEQRGLDTEYQDKMRKLFFGERM